MPVIGNQTDVTIVGGGGGGLANPVSLQATVSSALAGYTVPAGTMVKVRAWGNSGTVFETNAGGIFHQLDPSLTVNSASDEYTFGPGAHLQLQGPGGTFKGFIGVELS